MTVNKVADFFGVRYLRVERLKKERVDGKS
jgi:hypothetical protein